MDIVLKMAQDFSKIHLSNVKKPEEKIELVRLQLYKIDEPLDKIKFINILYETNRSNFEAHYKDCPDKENCILNYNHEVISYFLTQELNRLGIMTKAESFSNDEQDILNKKIDTILENIQTLKDGQQIIYEDLLLELNELKDLYFLGKKKWHQIWLGKICEMTLSGIISETISKQIIDEIKNIQLFLPE